MREEPQGERRGRPTLQELCEKVWQQEDLFWKEDTEADECESTEPTKFSEHYIDFEDKVNQ